VSVSQSQLLAKQENQLIKIYLLTDALAERQELSRRAGQDRRP
jgi:hypothetical protein